MSAASFFTSHVSSPRRAIWPWTAWVGAMSTTVALLVSAGLEGHDWQVATVMGIAFAIAANVLALPRSVRSHA